MEAKPGEMNAGFAFFSFGYLFMGIDSHFSEYFFRVSYLPRILGILENGSARRQYHKATLV